MTDETKATPSDRADAADDLIDAIERAEFALIEAGAMVTRDLFPGIEGRLKTNLDKGCEFLAAARREASIQGYEQHRRVVAMDAAKVLADQINALDEPVKVAIRASWPVGVPALSRPTFGLVHVDRVRALIEDKIAAVGEGGASADRPPSAQGDESGDAGLVTPAAGSSPGVPPETPDVPTDVPSEESDVNDDPREPVDPAVVDRLIKRIYALPDELQAECEAHLASEEVDLLHVTKAYVPNISGLISAWEAKVPKGPESRANALAARAITHEQESKPAEREIA